MEIILDKNEFDLQLEKLEKLYKDTENFPEWHREV